MLWGNLVKTQKNTTLCILKLKMCIREILEEKPKRIWKESTMRHLWSVFLEKTHLRGNAANSNPHYLKFKPLCYKSHPCFRNGFLKSRMKNFQTKHTPTPTPTPLLVLSRKVWEFRVLHLGFTKRRVFQTTLDHCREAWLEQDLALSKPLQVSADSHFPELSWKFPIQGSMGESCSPAMSELLQEELPSASSALRSAGQEFQRNFLGPESQDLCFFIQNPDISVSASRGTSALQQLPWAAQGCEVPPVSISTSILGICAQEQNILFWQQPKGN